MKTIDGVWIGSDGRITANGGREIITNDFIKWREVNGMWWAAAGSIRVYDLDRVSPHELSQAKTLLDLCERLRLMVKDDGWSSDGGRPGSPLDYEFIVLATDGIDLIRYEGDGASVSFSHVGAYTAIGSGSDYALGAMSVVGYLGLFAECAVSDFVEAGVNAACRFDPGCGGEFFIKEIRA